jgi:hypothetical protein
MLQNYGAITQALMGTLFTWGLTAAGAGMVVIFNGTQVRIVMCHTAYYVLFYGLSFISLSVTRMQHAKHL